MVIPHYTYLVMKIPGPNGVLCLKGDVRHTYLCDKESCELAESLVMEEESQGGIIEVGSSEEGAPSRKAAKGGSLPGPNLTESIKTSDSDGTTESVQKEA